MDLCMAVDASRSYEDEQPAEAWLFAGMMLGATPVWVIV